MLMADVDENEIIDSNGTRLEHHSRQFIDFRPRKWRSSRFLLVAPVALVALVLALVVVVF